MDIEFVPAVDQNGKPEFAAMRILAALTINVDR
jgi:hypothetical protein